AVYYTTLSLPATNVSAHGGSASRSGAAGTIYLKDSAQANGDLIVDNGGITSNQVTPLRLTSGTLRSLTVRGRGSLGIGSADVPSLTVEQPVLATTNAVLTVGDNVSLTVTNASGFDVQVQSGAVVTLAGLSTLAANAIRVNGGTLTSNID